MYLRAAARSLLHRAEACCSSPSTSHAWTISRRALTRGTGRPIKLPLLRSSLRITVRTASSHYTAEPSRSSDGAFSEVNGQHAKDTGDDGKGTVTAPRRSAWGNTVVQDENADVIHPEGDSRTLTRSEAMSTLKELGLDPTITPRTSFVESSACFCSLDGMATVSPYTGKVLCTACGKSDEFSVYEKRVRILKKEEKSDDGRTTAEEETRTVEETLSRMAQANEDTDLYDRVSYLDLVSQQEEAAARKKAERADRLRRLMDGAETLSPRDADLPAAFDRDREARMLPIPVDPDIKFLWDKSTPVMEVDREEKIELLELQRMLGIDKISFDTLNRYYVAYHLNTYDFPAIIYPRFRGQYSRNRYPHGLKVIRRIKDRLEKENYPVDENRFTGIFGLHMVTPADRKVIITTNERDALAIFEATGMVALALPRGEIPDEQVVSYLEDFDAVVLWFPVRHLDCARDYANMLNASRCYLIKNADRPIELLRHGQMKEIARVVKEDGIRVRDRGFRSMIDVRDELRTEITKNRSNALGLAQWKRFAPLNRYMWGFRPGEMTVITGQTGVGKTTFLTEYALDLFSQGVKTLFCSFEMSDERILKWMLIQYAGIPLERVDMHPLVEQWLDKFERTKGSLTIMKTDLFRDKSINEIAQAIENHVISTGAQHVVIDNLQFLVGMSLMTNDHATAWDRHNAQERFVGLLRRMVTDLGVHVTVVVHPRKTESDTDLEVQHFGGTARVTQEADNVFAIQRRKDELSRKPRKFLTILKNRYNGKLVEGDTLEMIFQPATYSHTLVDLTK